MVKDIAFTAYPAKDVAALRAFYERHLDIAFGEPYAEDGVEKYAEAQVGNACFAIMTNEWHGVEPCGGVAFEVTDLAASLAALRSGDVKTEEIHETPVCRLASFRDPEGNKVTLHQTTVPH